MSTCQECKQECDAVVVDYGIGSYEFWGAKCNDTRLALVSECCEADVRDGSGHLMDLSDLEEEGER